MAGFRGGGGNADDLRFTSDEEERRRKLEEERARIAASVGSKGKVKVEGGKSRPSSPPPPPLPPRRLKAGLTDVQKVEVVPGGPAKPTTGSRGGSLRSEPSERPRKSDPVANTSYGTAELEDLGWAVAHHVLDGAGDARLVDFRNRQRVGADGAINWKTFVELKAFGRSMPGSVQLTVAEFERAVERRERYLLVLVSGLEVGEETRVKIVFDPVRTAAVARSELIRLSDLANAAGLELFVGDKVSAEPKATN